jgi:hypothetical protein
VAGLLDRIDDRLALLVTGDRAAADRQRSLAAAVEWSYRLVDEPERRAFRLISVFPAGFTLQAAEAVAGAGAGPELLRLVDCSLLSPPQPGPDDRSRYGMLETLRAYGAGLLATTSEADAAAAALAGYALGVAEHAAAGLRTGAAEAAAARWLDAEDAAMRQVLAWSMRRDPLIALRLAVALAPWWFLRGRLADCHGLLREVSGRAVLGTDEWCATQTWLGYAAAESGDLAGALGHFTMAGDAIEDRGGSRVLAECLYGRLRALNCLGRTAEAAADARRWLALAGELGDPAGEAVAVMALSAAADYDGDLGGAVRLARQSARIRVGVPGWLARAGSFIVTHVLTEGGELAAAGEVCAAALTQARDAGDLFPRCPCWGRWRCWTCGPVASRTPRRDCERHYGWPRGPGQITCSTACTGAGTCAPRPGATPRPSRSGPRTQRSATRDTPTRP